MPILRIPAPLRSYTGGQGDLTLQGSTFEEVLQDLINQHPALTPHLFSSNGNLRPFVNLFLGERNVKELQGMQTLLKQDDQLRLIPSMAGG